MLAFVLEPVSRWQWHSACAQIENGTTWLHAKDPADDMCTSRPSCTCPPQGKQGAGGEFWPMPPEGATSSWKVHTIVQDKHLTTSHRVTTGQVGVNTRPAGRRVPQLCTVLGRASLVWLASLELICTSAAQNATRRLRACAFRSKDRRVRPNAPWRAFQRCREAAFRTRRNATSQSWFSTCLCLEPKRQCCAQSKPNGRAT